MLRFALFDLDDTLYPMGNGIMQAVNDRMRQYIETKYNLSPQDAHTLQKRYWMQYGTTLRGLLMEHEIDPLDYLCFVHDIDLSLYLAADAHLRAVLERIPLERVIVTNADAPHAERTLAALGVADLFSRIFDVVFMEYECKPAPGAYSRVLKALGARGEECVLIEDAARNLTAARELGIKTILVASPHPSPDADLAIATIYEVADAIQSLNGAAPPPA